MGLRRDVRLVFDLAKTLIRRRRAHRLLSAALADRPALEPDSIEIVVYFADEPVNLYQLRQWYAPLAELSGSHRVAILSRSVHTTLALLDESPVPVVYARTVAALERSLRHQRARLVLYVNQNSKNFQMMRYGRRWHVFINHGESDKMYMTTNQFKAYDYSLVAGEAALARLRKVLWDYDFDKRAIAIGRPQADHFAGEVPYPADDRVVVLYAPTWEGDRASAAYGSVVSHGLPLVKALLASERHRVIYRPHPRSGVVDPDYGRANREIIAAIASANARNSAAHHIYDDKPTMGWQLAAADVAITDISAMVYDRLAVGKPLFVTRPVSEAAVVDSGGYLAHCEWLTAEAAPDIISRADELMTNEQARLRLTHWVTRYFGDTTPGKATARFHAAVEHLLVEWERHAALHAVELAEAEQEAEAEDRREAAGTAEDGTADDGPDPDD